MKQARRYVVSGRVQGVGFRFFAERCANQLKITGYVRNCADGTVEACAAGEQPALDEFAAQLRKGPPGARVDDVQETGINIDHRYKRFVIEP